MKNKKNRREFMKAGALLSLAARTVLASAPAQTRGTLPINVIVYDEQYPESVAFARAVRNPEIAVRGIRRDVGKLWFDELDARCSEASAAIAGLTPECSLFVLEQLAWERGFHLVYRGDHELTEGGGAFHTILGNENSTAAPAAPNAHWPATVAHLVTHFPLPIQAPPNVSRRRPIARDGEWLVSWILASRFRSCA